MERMLAKIILIMSLDTFIIAFSTRKHAQKSTTHMNAAKIASTCIQAKGHVKDRHNQTNNHSRKLKQTITNMRALTKTIQARKQK